MVRKIVDVVCNLNRTRSRYVAKRLQEYCDEHMMNVGVRSYGVEAPDLPGFNQYTQKRASEADLILTMDFYVTNKVMRDYLGRDITKLRNLRIPDIFEPEDPEWKRTMLDAADRLRATYLSGLDPEKTSAYVESMFQRDVENAIFGNENQGNPEYHNKNILVPFDVLRKTINFRIKDIAGLI